MERVIAERIKTGEILSWDVPLLDATSSRELSAPGGIRGYAAPVTTSLLGDDGLPLIREWSTALYHEIDGSIRGAGIVVRINETEDGKFAVEAPGFTTYPHGIINTKTYAPGEGADALDVYRHLWDHVQSFPDGDLGVTVDPLLSGKTLDETEEFTRRGGGKGTRVIPYRLPWWEFRDCGQEMNSMLDIANADYIERHGWNTQHTGFTHHVDLGIPRVGRKRDDLRFVEGENIEAAVPLTIDGDNFAQHAIAVGRGEGRKMIHSEVAHVDDRLRRTALVVDKAAWQWKADRLARREYHRRSDTKGFEAVVVKDHPNARIANIDPGDDIFVEARLRWYGLTRMWVRVLSIEQAISGEDIAVLRVARSDQFRY